MDLVLPKNRTITNGLLALNYSYALSMTILGPMIPVLQEKYKIGHAQAGILPFVQGMGGVIFQIAGILIVSRFSKIRTIGVICTIYCLSFLLLFSASQYAWVIVAFFMIGAVSRLFDTVANAYLVLLENEKRGFYMNILHAVYGCGALTGSLFVGWLFDFLNISLNEIFLALFALCTTVCLYVFFKLRAGIVGKPSQSDVSKGVVDADIRKIFALLSRKDVIVYIVLAFGYVGFSASLSSWLPSYMLETGRATFLVAGMSVSVFWIGIISGRFVSSFMIQRFNARMLLPVTNLICGVVLLATFGVQSNPGLLMGLYCCGGFFIGPTMPLAILDAKSKYNDNEAVIPIIMIFSTVGLMAVPWAIGCVSEQSGLRTALSILNLVPFAMGFLSMRLLARKTKLYS